METRHLLGFDIGGTKSAVVLGDETGRVLDRVQIATAEPDVTMTLLLDAAKQMSRAASPLPPGVAACGMSVGSPLSREHGLVQSPANLPHWVNVPVRDMVQRVFPAVPFNLENDADAAALAEWRWGLDRKLDHVVYLTCGTGQGAGLILGGRLHRGACNLAGEIGHVRLLPLGPVGCRKAGSVEGLTSGRALGELAKLRLAEGEPSTLNALPLQEVTGKDVVEAIAAGDRFARDVALELAEYLGRACAILIDVLNPQRISLGSLAIRLHHLDSDFLGCVRRNAGSEAMKRSFEACAIDVAALGDQVQDLGALAAAAEALP